VSVIKPKAGEQRDRCQNAEAERREELEKPSAKRMEVVCWRTVTEAMRFLRAIFYSFGFSFSELSTPIKGRLRYCPP
jgi:hypothetical protein